MSNTTFVTQPYLPPLKDFLPYLEEIWENKWLTNNGPMHQKLEGELAQYLKVPYVSLFCNGMAALQTSLNCLCIKGEVITTPFTFVATAHAISLHGCTPVFCDIDSKTLNIDVGKIEGLITDKTTAIMPVHVYGHPCDTEAIERIAKKYKLRVIYDAAHAFAVKKDGKSILLEGDLSMLSFHATKVFSTLEGGAIVSHDLETKTRVDQLKNFGIQNEESTPNIAGNGKMNEVQAAFGLMQLEKVDKQINHRKSIAERYRGLLSQVNGLRVFTEMEGVESNYGYFPVLVEHDFSMTRDGLYDLLKVNQIHARKYFYPLISSFPPYKNLPSSHKDLLPMANKYAQQILCLPIFPDLELAIVEKIVDIIKRLG